MRRIFQSIRRFRLSKGARFALLACFASLALALFAPSAQATFHLINITQVYPGSIAHPESSYVELQMYAPEQNFVANHFVELLDANGDPIEKLTFAEDLPSPSVTLQRILIGDDGVEAAFGVKPDLIDPGFKVPARGGAVCWDTLDCASWGDFAGATTPSSGVPADPPGIPDGLALRRFVTGGNCGNRLDGADDSNDSEEDFGDGVPSPQSYATVPPPSECTSPLPTPVTTIEERPANPTNAASAKFSFEAKPAAEGFECRLDLGAFTECDAGSADYTSLAEGVHSFRVRGVNANGTGHTASYSWNVDLTAPMASFVVTPADPSPGKSASFRYSSNEPGSKFECKLEPPAASFAPCDTQPKVFTNLEDGDYEFEVRAVDKAGNVQVEPSAYSWTVDNSLEDTTPPETTITSKPPDPSTSPNASFSYSSSEAGSHFECKLDGGSFSGCPATGASYPGLAEGPHSFQVRAIDASNNVDPTPAGYSFSVVSGPAQAGPPPASNPTSGTRKTAAAPNTTIAKAAAKTRDRTPTFRFSSSKPGAGFQCRLDRGSFKACRSPFTTKTLAFGAHTLTVRAVAGGAADPSPAKLNFKIVKKA
jgi:hypothetical protein